MALFCRKIRKKGIIWLSHANLAQPQQLKTQDTIRSPSTKPEECY